MSAKRQGTSFVVGVLAATIFASTASAGTWSEDTDAGELPGTAATTSGVGALTEISGQATGDQDVDMYRICISAPAEFSATTSGTVIDPQLFLFDASGEGVESNDDIVCTVNRQSRLVAGNPDGPTAAGAYYLAIDRWDKEPQSADGAIFPDTCDPGAYIVNGPTGPGGASPITSWNNNGNAGQEGGGTSYTISLTGARFCNQQVTIDVKPGSSTNPINLKSKGVIPVAVLTTPDFDAATIDPFTACLGAACSEAHGQTHLEDVDGDGDLDAVLHFDTQATGIQPGDTEVCLTANAANGETITGCDTITITP